MAPRFIWNMMMYHVGRGGSSSVASESISVGSTNRRPLPGPVGSYIAPLAIQQKKNLRRDRPGRIATMFGRDPAVRPSAVFGPLVALGWDRFSRGTGNPGVRVPGLLGAGPMMRRSRIDPSLEPWPFHSARAVDQRQRGLKRGDEPLVGGGRAPKRRLDVLWVSLVGRGPSFWVSGTSSWVLIKNTSPREALEVLRNWRRSPCLRVVFRFDLRLASCVWGCRSEWWVGNAARGGRRRSSRPIAQFMAAFPCESIVSQSRCGTASSPGSSIPDIFLSPLMILGTQWYILFNVIGRARSANTGRRNALW